MPAETKTAQDLRDTSSDLFAVYSADLTTEGFALFSLEPNARAFAEAYEAANGRRLSVARNRDSRYVVRPWPCP